LTTTQFQAVGRRKEAVARVYLRPGSGAVSVNGRKFEDYFPNDVLKMVIRQPLQLTETTDKFDIVASVDGGAWPARPARSATASRAPSVSSTASSAAPSRRRVSSRATPG